MRNNHDYKKGVKNLFAMMDSLGNDHLKINTITIAPGTHRQQEISVTDIEELEESEEDDNLNEDTNDEASVHSITINKIPIWKACCPYEVICVQTDSGMFHFFPSGQRGVVQVC